MSRCILYRKSEYILVRNGNGSGTYYTIVNTKLNTHVHVNQGMKLSKLIINRAINEDILNTSLFIKNKVLILLGKNEDWNKNHSKLKIKNHNQY